MNSEIKAIESALEESIEDLILSRQERRDLRSLIAETKIHPSQRDWLLSRLRDIALENSGRASSELLIAWFYEGVKLFSPKAADTPRSRAYFSPGEECRDAILGQIRAASRNIDICVFTISDNIIRDALVSAHQVGKKIRIISDNDKSLDMGSDIQFLMRLGIAVHLDKTKDHMHHKFALFDNEVLLNGSYNWTRSAAERNFENITLTEDEGQVEAFTKEFERLWQLLA